VSREPVVGIVGAGPVGLVTAARLAGFGIPSVVMEANPTLVKRGSKACLIQGDALEVLDKVGCAEPVAAEGVTWQVGHTYVRDREIRREVYPRPIGFGPFVNISQYRIEQILLAKVEAESLCQVWWSHRVVAVRQDPDTVTVGMETPEGYREHRFRYLVACDGVHSELRELLGARWTGYSHGDRFLITDIRAELPFPKERHFHYDPSFNPGRQLVIHPQPSHMWRIDWQLPPDVDIEAERRTGEFERRVRRVIGETPYEVDWWSTYRFHQRVVDQFRVGRAFLAGDAAHALPPYGARGMNSGIQDGDNLAWKLALVLRGRADDRLLDTYHIERHAAARENLRVTEATIRFMVPPNLPRRLVRGLVLWLSHPFRAIRRHVNSGRMAEPFVYTDSPIVAPASQHPLLGRLAPDGWVEVAGRRQRLRRLFGQEFVALCFGVLMEPAISDLPVRYVVVLPEPVDHAGQAVVAVDRSGRLAAEYRMTTPGWLLVRPDGHIAAASDRPEDLAGALRRSAYLLERVPERV
jgi:3-(3-hydroxy-phenyl)propionate hydroxylase